MDELFGRESPLSSMYLYLTKENRMFRSTYFAIALALCCFAPVMGQDKKAEKKEPNRVEAVLESLDVKARTITVRLGKTVDEVLSEKMRERAKGKEESKPAGEKKTFTLANRHVEIYLKFRTSPSVANNVEHELKDLQKMIGYPMELETDGKTTVSGIVVYRGTPWKFVEPKEAKP
jgi:hypothetical protein